MDPKKGDESNSTSPAPHQQFRKQRRRSNTFTNVVGVRPHGEYFGAGGNRRSSVINEDQDQDHAENNHNRSTNYYQVFGDNHLHSVDDDGNSRRGSISSVETTQDFFDHREADSRLNRQMGRARHTSTTVRPHQHLASSFHRRRTLGGSNNDAMWRERRGSGSDQPLLGDYGGQVDYEAVTDALNGSDSFAITMDDPNDGNNRFQNFMDVESDVDQPDSKPSSRRSSIASSLHDVCFPVDQQEIDSIQEKIWPDLDILNEFAEEEQKEITATEQAIVNDLTGERTYSLTSDQGGTNANVQQINEADLQGRLRPHRIVPWVQRAKDGKRKKQRKKKYGYSQFDEKAANYRFSYFREDLDATIHSPNISGLLQPGQTFADLFPPRISLSGGCEAYEYDPTASQHQQQQPQPAQPQASQGLGPSPLLKAVSTPLRSQTPVSSGPGSPISGQPRPQASRRQTTTATPVPPTHVSAPAPMAASKSGSQMTSLPPQSTGSPPPVAPFWLDVMNPTEEEMKVISKAFGIHPLTTEDIFLGETREKVELFSNYYLVCFRSIDTNWEKEKNRERERRSHRNSASKQQTSATSGSGSIGQDGLRRRKGGGSDRPPKDKSETTSAKKRAKSQARKNELKALNMYIVVFHEGVLTFHFAPTYHPTNVRKRARLLQDYITVSSDWVSYALIDDITDGFAPLIEAIENEVNSIEDSILKMHSGDYSDSDESSSDDDDDDEYAVKKNSALASSTSSSSSSSSSSKHVWKERGDMLRRIGECRKRVMSMLRLLGSKADVIKGFSKRCNEQWRVAPRSEIALFLGDIQDHIVTMVQSLNHYEKLLARSHSNYLAQINIDMTRVNNDMNDVLGRITVLGTIVLPMNIVTGLWGMNVLVPGQDIPNLNWFYGITASLVLFAILCFVVARKVYKI